MEIKFNNLKSRREFLSNSLTGLGATALGSLINPISNTFRSHSSGKIPHFAPKAKRVIFLFQAGGPSQMDLFDYKPLLNQLNGKEIPESIRGKQRVSGMVSAQGKFPIAGSHFKFNQYGESGSWVSDLMPHTAEIVDDLCFIKSMNTNAINHDPGVTFIQTGSEQTGRPSMGSWVSYGLGSSNKNLPDYVVLLSRGIRIQTTLKSTLWGNGFLPSHHQGVQFRSGKDVIHYLNNPNGVDKIKRRKALDFIQNMNEIEYQTSHDKEIATQIKQYEMAYRMQMSVPDVTDVSKEKDKIKEMYGPDVNVPGSFAANCLLARKLAEQDVNFIQLYHMGWDHHFDLPSRLRASCQQTDQPVAGLIKDLKMRGLLEDTLIIWGGEFGRTSFSQGMLTNNNYGRDHHPRCFTVWLAGGGVKKGLAYGHTNEFGYNIIQDPVHVHDLQATILHLLGMDHERLTYKHQGRYYRLTDVHGKVVKGILA